MENGLPALMIAAIMMLSTVLISRGGFIGVDGVSQELKASEMRYAQQSRTGLAVTGTSIDATGANITITVRNDGATPVADFEGMDVLIQYFGETGTRYDKWIAYTSGALSSDRWTTGVEVTLRQPQRVQTQHQDEPLPPREGLSLGV